MDFLAASARYWGARIVLRLSLNAQAMKFIYYKTVRVFMVG